MKQKNGLWIDENNNTWNCDYFSKEQAESHCKTLLRCHECSGCRECRGCSECHGCHGCHGCSGCRECRECSGCHEQNSKIGGGFTVPKIENIHNEVLKAVSGEGAFDMSDWHTCDSTHCRAGWVVHLAGKAGYKLENKTSCLFAAMQIYKASSEIRVSPPRFFDNNQTAMTDIKHCAELESNSES